MIRITILSTFLCVLFLSPFTFADNHVPAEPRSLEAAKDRMIDIDKDKKPVSKLVEKGQMKDKADQIDKEMPCSEHGKEHGECDEIKEKMKQHQRDKDEAMNDRKKASMPREKRVLTSIYISTVLLKHLNNTGAGTK